MVSLLEKLRSGLFCFTKLSFLQSRKTKLIIFIFLSGIIYYSIQFSYAYSYKYIRITATEKDLSIIQSKAKSFKLDDVGDRYLTGYISNEDLTNLKELHYKYIIEKSDKYRMLSREEAFKGYHTYESMTNELKDYAAKYPEITSLFSIGKTVQGREMWFMKISKHLEDTGKPEVRFSSTMHGDEVVGMELMMNLIKLLLENYSQDTRIKNLVDNLEIYIMPNMNPDGTKAQERYNADGIDLNRDFPDFEYNDEPSLEGRAIETQNMMKFLSSRHFELGASFHGGAVVVNMPWDTVADLPPDEAFIEKTALTYSKNNEPMYNDTYFPQGITNGYAWYEVDGGMQDYSYYYNGEVHFTIEVSEQKWPSSSYLASYWKDNKESLLSFLEKGFQGIHGYVYDKNSKKPLKAKVQLLENSLAVFSSETIGDYHKLINPGTYTLLVNAPNYEEYKSTVVVNEGGTFDVNIELESVVRK